MSCISTTLSESNSQIYLNEALQVFIVTSNTNDNVSLYSNRDSRPLVASRYMSQAKPEDPLSSTCFFQPEIRVACLVRLFWNKDAWAVTFRYGPESDAFVPTNQCGLYGPSFGQVFSNLFDMQVAERLSKANTYVFAITSERGRVVVRFLYALGANMWVIDPRGFDVLKPWRQFTNRNPSQIRGAWLVQYDLANKTHRKVHKSDAESWAACHPSKPPRLHITFDQDEKVPTTPEPATPVQSLQFGSSRGRCRQESVLLSPQEYPVEVTHFESEDQALQLETDRLDKFLFRTLHLC